MRPPRALFAGVGVYRRAPLRAPLVTRARRWLLALLVPLAAITALVSLDHAVVDVRPASTRVHAPRPTSPAAPVDPPVRPLTDVVSLAGDWNGVWLAVTRDGSRYAWGDRDEPDTSSRSRARRLDVGLPATAVRQVADGSCGRASGNGHHFDLLTPEGVQRLSQWGGTGPYEADAAQLDVAEPVVDLDAAGSVWITRSASGLVRLGSRCESSEHYYPSPDRPASAPARFSDAASVAAGEDLACVTTGAGAVHCWAFRSVRPAAIVGDVRDGLAIRSGPARVPVPPTTQVLVDRDRACGVARGGDVWCWSQEASAELRWRAWRHPWLRDAARIHVSNDQLCATLRDRRVVCEAPRPQTWPPQVAPVLPRVELAGLRGAAQLISHGPWGGCARLDDGTVRCWGEGELPDGRMRRSPTPARADVDEPLTSLAAGTAHVCGLGHSGRVWCWGRHRGHDDRQVRPHAVESVVGAVELAVGGTHTCARLADGGVSCWGQNDAGQCGEAREGDRPVAPRRVPGLDRVVGVSAGEEHTCARLVDGTVRCWGAFDAGWPGRPRIHGAVHPLDVPLPFAAGALVSVDGHTCALDGAGRSVCWGGRESESADGVGLAPDRMTVGHGRWWVCRASGTAVRCAPRVTPPPEGHDAPGSVRLPSAPRVVTVGEDFVCALTVDGTAWCWGENGAGQVGTGAPGEVSIDAPALVVR